MTKTARNFFSEQERNKITESIRKAESHTAAEICVHLENFCWGSPVRRAEKVFINNKMHQTQWRNGVLFYFAVISRKLAIIGDKGIYERVPEEVWDNMVKKLIQAIQNNDDKAEVLCSCIEEIGEWLKIYFPVTDKNNPNELSDEISFS